jgi:hypothetical protein
MNPDKLFDYLDGKLAATERAQLEERIAADPALQRELAIARKIHEGMPGSREVIGSIDGASNLTERGAVLGRRVATAFAALVFLNVLLGLWFIFQKEKKSPDASRQEAGMRQELRQSLEKTAASALPTPTIEADEIKITAPVLQEEMIASKVIAAATEVGGSGAKALADENGIVMLADIPFNREGEFRQRLAPLGASPANSVKPSEKRSAPNERKFLQVRIVRAAAGKKP